MIHNYYLYEEDGQLSMIPWDYNLAFGGFSAGGFGGGAEMPQDAGEHFGSEEVSGEETGDEETVQSGGQEIYLPRHVVTGDELGKFLYRYSGIRRYGGIQADAGMDL